MAQGYRLKGLDHLQRKLKELPENVKTEVIQAVQDAADKVVLKAVNLAPVDVGPLRQSIGNEPKNGGLNYLIFVNVEYAAWIEFGTGTNVRIPPGLEQYAKQFKRSGNASYSMIARPFFFPGYFEERAKLIETLKKILAKSVK